MKCKRNSAWKLLLTKILIIMKKNYLPLKAITLFILCISVGIVSANDPLKEKRIVLVGNPTTEAGDQNLMDSLSEWMTANYMLASDFNGLEESAFDTIDCVLFSETILSTDVPAFGNDLNFPVPSIVMEMSVFDNEADKWSLLKDDAVFEAHGSPVAEDLQWIIVDNTHYITEIYNSYEVVSYATGTPNRGMGYITGFKGDVDVLAKPNSQVDNADVAAIAVVNDYDILFMSVAKDYPAAGIATPDLFKVLKRGCEFLLDVIPGGPSGIKDKATDPFGLTTFPSPAADNLTIRFVADHNCHATVTILNITGKQLSVLSDETRQGNNYLSLDVSNYPAGLYFVELKMGDKIGNTKFIVK